MTDCCHEIVNFPNQNTDNQIIYNYAKSYIV